MFLEISCCAFLNSANLETESNHHWDKFYDIHQNRFFKDRQWLFREFPELLFPASEQLDDTEPEKLVQGETKYESTLATSSAADSNEETQRDLKLEALFHCESAAKAQFRIFEVGCGAGNTVFPVLETNKYEIRINNNLSRYSMYIY